MLHCGMTIVQCLMKALTPSPSIKRARFRKFKDMPENSKHDICRKNTEVRSYKVIKLDAVDHIPIHNGC